MPHRNQAKYITENLLTKVQYEQVKSEIRTNQTETSNDEKRKLEEQNKAENEK